MDVADDQTYEGATEPFCIIALETVNADVQQADCSSSNPFYSSWEPYPEAYSPPASDDEEALPALEPVEQPLTPIVVNHPAWFGPAAFASLPLPDSLLADPIAAYRRLPMEEPEIETDMEDSPSTDEMHSSSLTSTIVWPLCIIWVTWLLGVRWQVLLLLLPTATCGLLHINEGAEFLTGAPEGSQVTFGSTLWLLSFVYLAWALGVPRQDLLPFVAGAAFVMLPIVEGARTRRSVRLSLTAEERTAINVLASVPIHVWIVLAFVYRLRRRAALALRNAGYARRQPYADPWDKQRAVECLQRHLARSRLLADARAIGLGICTCGGLTPPWTGLTPPWTVLTASVSSERGLQQDPPHGAAASPDGPHQD